MSETPLLQRVLPYLKAAAGPSAEPLVEVDGPDRPVSRDLENGLRVLYVVDEGKVLRYVQARELTAAGVTVDDLHAHALANLAATASGQATIRQAGPVYALFLDGNLEASLLLLDDLWDNVLQSHVSSEFVAAVAARDVLAFSETASRDGVAELRAVIDRVWDGGDHLVSRGLFVRRGGRWEPFS